MKVHFIGAGPGAADLITVRGQALIRAAPVVLYAGSLVPPEIVALAPEHARLVDTAPLTLDEIIDEFTRAHGAGLDNLLVTGGLLANTWGTDSATPPDPQLLAAACQDAGVTPTAAIPTFVW